MPIRMQGRKSTKGGVYVGNGSIWANPYMGPHASRKTSRTLMKALYDDWIRSDDDRAHGLRNRMSKIAGKNLVCECPLDKACHADVLLEMANAPSASEQIGEA